MASLINLYQMVASKLSCLFHVVLLLARIKMAEVFFLAGLSKIESWESTLALFEYEYAVPLLPVSFAAISATFFELVMPPLIALGLFTRLAVVPLIIMTAVIEFTYGSFPEHVYWALLFGMILTYGPGRISADYYVAKYFNKKEQNAGQAAIESE